MTQQSQRKGQAAIEYLMNYAWAIALIIIVGIAIFALDIGGLRTSIQARGDVALQTGDTITVQDWAYTANDGNDTAAITVQNNGENQITLDMINLSQVQGITVTEKDWTDACTGVTLYTGDTSTNCDITIDEVSGTDPGVSTGEQVDVQFNITYTDEESGIQREIVKALTAEAE